MHNNNIRFIPWEKIFFTNTSLSVAKISTYLANILGWIEMPKPQIIFCVHKWRHYIIDWHHTSVATYFSWKDWIKWNIMPCYCIWCKWNDESIYYWKMGQLSLY